MTATTPDTTRLPKWAQEHIQSLQRQRDEAVTALRGYLDNQTVSSLYTDTALCLGDQPGGRGVSFVKHWIQADRVTFQLTDGEIQVRAVDGFDRIEIYALQSGLCIVPKVTNVVSIRPHDKYA